MTAPEADHAGMQPIAAQRSKTQGGVAALVAAISISGAQCQTFALAGTSPAMIKRERHEFRPYCVVAY
jgi:hypothetical protein